MKIESNQYVPILKWRQGEYQALTRLNESVKDHIVPLIVVPPIEFDFEERVAKKTAQDHIEPFSKRFSDKWGRHTLIELHTSLDSETMDNGLSVVSHIFTELRKEDLLVVPVCGFSSSNILLNEIKKIVAIDNKGICIRVRLEELMNPSFNSSVDNLMTKLLIKHTDIDLVLDIGKPQSFTPYNIFSKAIISAVKKINQLNDFRSFIFSATSLNLSEIRKPGGEVTRHEWLLYQQLIKDINDLRTPSFGDYTIDTPEFLKQDMRMIKPAGKIVYTGDDVWFITKGTAYRDNPAQMKDLCKIIVQSSHYCGPAFSHGDERINDTMNGTANTGNLSTWKQVGVNHHLTKVVNQLSIFHGSQI